MDGQSKQRTVPLDHLPGRASRLVGRDEMQEIRFHGRGGQGTVLAAIALAKAFFTAGYEVQTFPVFGSERRGAPVEAYLRLDDRKILVRSNVYAPDHVMVQDLHLLGIVQVTRGLKPGGWILLNAPELPRDLGPFEGFRLAHVDAAAIALRHELGTTTQPIINTAMMGAFARMLGAPPLDAVTEAIRDAMPRKPEQNMAAARDAYAAVVLAGPVRDGRLALAAGAGFLEGGR
jgi:pyruvate ferredoxin oxidoreductase gamma subunit/2-oxoisovalerate ferredoxin oxidoreductase gamma subunit